MNHKIFLHSLILLYFGVTTSLLHLQQQASAMATKNRIKLIVILEPEIPPLGAASLYLPPEEFSTNSSLISKLRNARLLAKLHEDPIEVYQTSKLQSNSSSAREKGLQKKNRGNFKRLDVQHKVTWWQPLIGQVIFPGIETIWMIWKEKLYFNRFYEMPKNFGQDVFAVYDQINSGIPVISNSRK